MSREIVSEAIIGLLVDSGKAFYGHMANNVSIILNDKLPAIAGVSLNRFPVQLMINTELFAKETPALRRAIIEHEMLHIVLLHGSRASKICDLNNPIERMLHNIATDQTINERIEELYTDGRFVNIKLIREKCKDATIPEGESSEYYFNKLKDASKEDLEMYDKLKKMIENGELILDDHSELEGDGKQSDTMIEGMVSGMVAKALQDLKSRAGTVPSNIAKDIENLLDNKITWKQVLRQFHAKCLNSKKASSRKKRNRRYGVMFAGKKSVPDLHVAVCIDTSGSMAGTLDQVYSELKSMSTTGTKLTVIECDCSVQRVYEFNSKSTPEFKGYGGTAYNPALEEARKIEVDAILYLGDMDSSDEVVVKPKVPLLWVIFGRSNPPANFGRKLYVDDQS